MSTEKRQRQKAGRQARIEAEQKRVKRKQAVRRAITLAVVAVVVIGVAIWISSGSSKPKKVNAAAASSTTSTTKASSTTTAPKSSTTGGSGNTNPSAITTSANCPSSLSTTLNKPSYPSAPLMSLNTSKTYTATVTTDVGTFTIQLDAPTAPKTVNNFVFLAQHHFYDCVVFHRVIQSFMDQTGDPTGTGTGGPGYKFADELPAKATPQYPIGSVAMANSGPNTNGSQFFIVAGPAGESLAPNYSLFGQVTSGMSVVDKINADGSAASSSTGTPTIKHRILSVTIVES